MGACIPFGPELILPWRHEIKILIFLLFFTSFVFSCAIRNTTMRKYVMTLFQILFLKSLWRKYSFFIVFIRHDQYIVRLSEVLATAICCSHPYFVMTVDLIDDCCPISFVVSQFSYSHMLLYGDIIYHLFL